MVLLTRAALLLGLGLALGPGCASSPLGLEEAYVELSGPVEGDAGTTGEGTTAAIAWVWLWDGLLEGAVVEVPWEPRLAHYALEVPGPPAPEEATASAPAPELSGPALLWGLPVLAEPVDPDGSVELFVEPGRMQPWVTGQIDDATDLVEPGVDTRLVGVLRDHLLMAMATDAGVTRLGDHPDWDATAWCGLEEVAPGLTLYRRPLEHCEAWTALAAPGERTEFQQIPMGDPTP